MEQLKAVSSVSIFLLNYLVKISLSYFEACFPLLATLNYVHGLQLLKFNALKKKMEREYHFLFRIDCE